MPRPVGPKSLRLMNRMGESIQLLEAELDRVRALLARIEKQSSGYDSMSRLGIINEIAREALATPESD